MRYTAFGVVLIGVMIAGLGGYQYATGGSLGREESLPSLKLALLLGFAVTLLTAGVWMWAFGGKGYSVSGLIRRRHLAGDERLENEGSKHNL